MLLAIRRRLIDRIKRERSRDAVRASRDAIGGAIRSRRAICDSRRLTLSAMSKILAKRTQQASNARPVILTKRTQQPSNARPVILARRTQQASNAWPIILAKRTRQAKVEQKKCLQTRSVTFATLRDKTQGNSGLGCRRGEACLAPTARNSRGATVILAKRTQGLEQIQWLMPLIESISGMQLLRPSGNLDQLLECILGERCCGKFERHGVLHACVNAHDARGLRAFLRNEVGQHVPHRRFRQADAPDLG
jgi:hypothetical protein